MKTNRQQINVWQYSVFTPTFVVFFCRKHKRLKDEIWIAASPEKEQYGSDAKRIKFAKTKTNTSYEWWWWWWLSNSIKVISSFVLPCQGRMYFPGVPFREREAFHQSWFSLLKALWQLRGEVLWWRFYVKGSGKVHIKCHWRDVVSIAIYMGINVSYIEYALYLVFMLCTT